jgi:trimeric autotransporter adhesin
MRQRSLAAVSLFTMLFFMQELYTQNTKYGLGALHANTTGSNNSAFGTNALFSNTAGPANTGIGSSALYYNTTGGGNVANGVQALFNNTKGNANTATGNSALYYNTTGIVNTAIGSYALYKNSTGSYNTAGGSYALGFNTIGSFNTAIGYEALKGNNASGSYNTASGYRVLYANTSGSYNTANGNYALYSNTTGSYNIAIGGFSLYSNKGGNYNTATGYAALFYNTFGYYNTANGYFTLYNNTTGFQNTASGYYALHLNSSGTNNTATGALALFNNTTGFNNTATGNYALRKNSTGSRNTAIGDSAGASFSYNYSTFVGYKTTTSVSGLSNITVIGNAASATASNQVRIGNSSVTSIGGKVGWTTLSDGRFKQNIQEDVPGLEFITKLKPVTYTFDIAALDRASGISEVATAEEGLSKASASKEKHTGFIAQEVEKAASDLGYDFGGVDKPKNDQDHYGLRYAEFVVPLVKAVQELDSANKAKDEKIALLEEKLNEVLQRLGSQGISSASAWMKQNTPNPVRSRSAIQYFIPAELNSARILVTNAKGQQLKVYNVSGSGTVNFSAGTLPSGTYTYSLVSDGKTISSKKMVIVR